MKIVSHVVRINSQIFSGGKWHLLFDQSVNNYLLSTHCVEGIVLAVEAINSAIFWAPLVHPDPGQCHCLEKPIWRSAKTHKDTLTHGTLHVKCMAKAPHRTQTGNAGPSLLRPHSIWLC